MSGFPKIAQLASAGLIGLFGLVGCILCILAYNGSPLLYVPDILPRPLLDGFLAISIISLLAAPVGGIAAAKSLKPAAFAFMGVCAIVAVGLVYLGWNIDFFFYSYSNIRYQWVNLDSFRRLRIQGALQCCGVFDYPFVNAECPITSYMPCDYYISFFEWLYYYYGKQILYGLAVVPIACIGLSAVFVADLARQEKELQQQQQQVQQMQPVDKN